MIDEPALALVRAAVRERVGLELQSLPDVRLQAVLERVGFPEDEAAMERLVDELVVPETRFFRDAAVFAHLQTVLGAMAREREGLLRVLSAPSSTGQEAYSVAAACVLAGVPLERVRIEAVDVSAAAIARGRAGVYTAREMGGASADQMAVLATQGRHGWEIRPELRGVVSFRQANLIEAKALARAGYDVVLCRNLSIYFSVEARERLVENVAAALRPGGRLVLGSADYAEGFRERFVPCGPARAFLFEVRGADRPPAVAKRLLPVRRGAAKVFPIAVKMTEAVQPEEAEHLLAAARRLERDGDLRRAEKRCRQALYLAPDHLGAMEMLRGLWREMPHPRLQRALEERIRRRKERDA